MSLLQCNTLENVPVRDVHYFCRALRCLGLLLIRLTNVFNVPGAAPQQIGTGDISRA